MMPLRARMIEARSPAAVTSPSWPIGGWKRRFWASSCE